MTIDEVQRLPELFLTLKLLVDKDRRPGRFLLTGSVNVLLLPKMADSLAGRMEILTLLPLSCEEKSNIQSPFIDPLFDPNHTFKHTSEDVLDIELLAQQIIEGGYPEVETRKNLQRKSAWFEGYVTTLLQRDVRNLANIEGITKLPNILKLIATRSSSILNTIELSRTSMTSTSTLKRYLILLQALFLVELVPAWSNHLGKRLVKSPKVHLCDSGLLCYLLGLDVDGLIRNHSVWGSALETFVISEIKKRLTWSKTRGTLYHYRTQNGAEVDCVIEAQDGRIVGIEIKSSKTVSSQDLKGLLSLQETAQNTFSQGIILYLGNKVISFGPKLKALPISFLLS